jgi:anti-sigma B factor antagonist
MLVVTIHDRGESVVVHCTGRIVVGETEALRKAVMSLGKRQAVVLDLARVAAVDAGGLGLLVFLQAWLRTLGIDLLLANPKPHVRGLLELTRLDSVFTISSSEDRAWRHRIAAPAGDTTAANQPD